MCKVILRVVLKLVMVLLLVGVGLFISTNASIVYDFAEPRQFAGPDIYNPYHNLDTTSRWRRANFHAHTRVNGIFNECEFWPDSVYRAYESFDYDIIGISNHNKITHYPTTGECRMSIYEHGYNFLNYHLLVFGSERVWHFDNMLPLFASQHQFIIDRLSRDADIMQINHPHRTPLLDRDVFKKIGGYQLVELTSTVATIENEHWDWALSAGHYCHGILNDDMHRPNDSYNIAVRCSFLSLPDLSYPTVRQALLEGCFYSMRIPNYGQGDWERKREANSQLPYIKDIGLRDSTIYIEMSDVADSIKFIGSDHRVLHLVEASDTATYTMLHDDAYARIMVFYPEDAVIFTNAFARYDSSCEESPYRAGGYTPNWPLTILYNLLLAVCVVYVISLIYRIIRRR